MTNQKKSSNYDTKTTNTLNNNDGDLLDTAHDMSHDGLVGDGRADSPSKKSDINNAATIEKILDTPFSWCNILSLDRNQYLQRYPPHGKRTIQYYKAKVDYYTKNKHPQGMIMRILVYVDETKTIVREIHEWYENRLDKLYKRIRHILENKFVEYYLPGSLGNMKEYCEYPGKRRDIDFHVNGRLDGMYRREEIIGESIVEFFIGRTDFLTYRSILLTLEKDKTGSRSNFVLPGGGLAGDLYVLRINQKFDNDVNAESGNDVATRIFFLNEGKIITYYHYANGKITQTIKVHHHNKNVVNIAGNNNMASDENNSDNLVNELEENQEAALIERESFTSVKVSYTQILNILKIRHDEETGVNLEKTVFERALEFAEKGATGAINNDVENDVDMKGVDYLTPFLRIVKNLNKIKKEEALEVRQNCLDALKARLVERANIIQSRLNEENIKLARKQEQFQRSQREGDLSTEEYERYCTEAMFRIQILEQRLINHEDTALKKFCELDVKLANDPRLKVLRS